MEKSKLKKLSLSQAKEVVIESAYNARLVMVAGHTRSLAEQDLNKLPHPQVIEREGRLYVVDGGHRIQAAVKKKQGIVVEVLEANDERAIVMGLIANIIHGLKLIPIEVALQPL